MGVIRRCGSWAKRFIEHPYTKLLAFVVVIIFVVLGFRSLERQQAQIQSSRIESCQRGNRDRAVLRGLLHASFDALPGAEDDLARLDLCYSDVPCQARVDGKEEEPTDPVCEELLRRYATGGGGPTGAATRGTAITIAAANVLDGRNAA